MLNLRFCAIEGALHRIRSLLEGYFHRCNESFGEKLRRFREKSVPLHPFSINVDRFGLLATTVKNAKTTWINQIKVQSTNGFYFLLFNYQ